MNQMLIVACLIPATVVSAQIWTDISTNFPGRTGSVGPMATDGEYLYVFRFGGDSGVYRTTDETSFEVINIVEGTTAYTLTNLVLNFVKLDNGYVWLGTDPRGTTGASALYRLTPGETNWEKAVTSGIPADVYVGLSGITYDADHSSYFVASSTAGVYVSANFNDLSRRGSCARKIFSTSRLAFHCLGPAPSQESQRRSLDRGGGDETRQPVAAGKRQQAGANLRTHHLVMKSNQHPGNGLERISDTPSLLGLTPGGPLPWVALASRGIFAGCFARRLLASCLLAPLLALHLSQTGLAQTALANGGNRSDALSPAGNTDTWTFTVSAGDHVFLRASQTSGGTAFAPHIRVFDDAQNLVGRASRSRSSSTSSARLDYVATASGTITRDVNSNLAGGTGNDRVDDLQMPGTIITPGAETGGQLANEARTEGTIAIGDLYARTFDTDGGSLVELRRDQPKRC